MFAKTYRIFKKVAPANSTKKIFPKMPEAKSKNYFAIFQRAQEIN